MRGGVLYGDAGCFRVLDVDIVNANAAADDQLQLAALGFVDVVGAYLSSAADYYGVKLLQCCTKLLGA